MCRRIWRVRRANSARILDSVFCAEKIGEFGGRILHETEIRKFLQKISPIPGGKFCKNCSFRISCRNPRRFLQKKSARNGNSRIFAETKPNSSGKVLHGFRFSHFVQNRRVFLRASSRAGAEKSPHEVGICDFVRIYITYSVPVPVPSRNGGGHACHGHRSGCEHGHG